MKITDIKQQQKNLSRFSIYADGKYVFSVSDWQVGSLGIKIGQEISADEIKKHKQDSDFGKIYDRTLRWLALRPRSEWEINTCLAKKTDNQEVIEEIKLKLAGLSQINDEAFARSWVNSRRSLKLTSKYRLRQELLQKHVAGEVISKVLADDETEDLEIIKKTIIKKQRQTRYQDHEKMMAYLSRQGFRYDEIKQALEQLRDDL